MTRKDYVIIARAIARSDIGLKAFNEVVENFVKELRADNPAFDADKFIAACRQ